MLGSVRSGVGALRAALERAGRRWSCCPTSAPACRAAATSATAATARWRSSAGPTRPARPCSRRRSRAASATAEFLDRWRLPGDARLAPVGGALRRARVRAARQAALTERAEAGRRHAADARPPRSWPGPHGRAAKRAAAAPARARAALVDDLTAHVGNTGAAHAGLLLADVLDRAEADQIIAVVSLADGADATLLRTTDALARAPARACRWPSRSRRRARLLRRRSSPGAASSTASRPAGRIPTAPAAPPSFRRRGLEVRVRRAAAARPAARVTCRRSGSA